MKITASTTIKAPISKVFEMFTDLKNLPERVTGIKKLEIITPPASMKVGTKWKELREVFGKEAEETMWVTALDKNKSYVVEAESHGTHYTSTYTFIEKDGATTVTLNFIGKPLTIGARLMGILFFFFAGSTKKLLCNDMNELKEILEK